MGEYTLMMLWERTLFHYLDLGHKVDVAVKSANEAVDAAKAKAKELDID